MLNVSSNVLQLACLGSLHPTVSSCTIIFFDHSELHSLHETSFFLKTQRMWYPVITLSDEVSLLSCSADNGWEAPDIRCLWYGYNYVYLFLEHEELNDNPRTVPGLQSKFSSSSWVMIETPNHPLSHLLRTVTTIWVPWRESNSIRFYLSNQQPEFILTKLLFQVQHLWYISSFSYRKLFFWCLFHGSAFRSED